MFRFWRRIAGAFLAALLVLSIVWPSCTFTGNVQAAGEPWQATEKESGQTAEEKKNVQENLNVTAKSLNPSIDTVLSSVRAYMLSIDTNPDFNSIWNAIGLTRSGLSVPASYVDTFYKNLYANLVQKNWVLTRTKFTEYSKLIIGLTAIGKDAQDIDGHNLLGYLSDFTDVTRQGFNGPIWALIALNSHPSYEIPLDPSAEEQTTEEGLIRYLLERECAAGGWTMTGTEPDSDITGMTIQALAPYYGKRDDVTRAVDRALAWLSSSQLPSGGYGTMGAETSESVVQVIVALSSLGIDCGMDDRFIKPDGSWPMTGLFQYYLPQGGFMHVAAGASNNGGGEGGTLNGMATEQGMYGTVAYKRLLDGKTALYDMSDVTLTPGEAVDISGVVNQDETETPATTPQPQKTTAGSSGEQIQSDADVRVSGIHLDYKQISVEVGKTRKLTATVQPGNASNKKITWISTDKKVATVNKHGKIMGVKEGTAKIKVKAKDGSGAKATCVVKVYASGDASGTTKTGSSAPVGSGNQTGGSASGSSGGTSGSSSGTTAAAAPQKNTVAAATQTAETGTAEETSGDWSFDGAAYIPETSGNAGGDNAGMLTADNAQGENAQSAGEETTITIKIPTSVLYVLTGAGGLGALEAIFFLLRRKGALGAALALLHKIRR
ncbi:MAG: Ig-like domain-containing protein [Clostridiales bacterium]|nr:Ig-like domain-containing protein [Clostridiales bacterium]